MGKDTNFVVKGYVATNVGQREHNEDSYLINEEARLFIVADGMGGHDKGEIASQFTTKNLSKIVRALKDESDVYGEVTDFEVLPVNTDLSIDSLLQFVVFYINKEIYEANELAYAKSLEGLSPVDREIASLNQKKKRMGTTLVSVFIGQDRAFITNIGDSRAYRIVGNTISQITNDHSVFEEKRRQGLLTPAELASKKGHNIITRSIGIKRDVKADITVLSLDPPERFLLCSDGLSNILDDETLLTLGQIEKLQVACNRLVDLAKNRGGKDNITAMLVDIKPNLSDDKGISSNLGDSTFGPEL